MTHVHLIGIGGSGISSIARVLLERGYTVSGSDRVLSQFAEDLRNAGVRIFEGHAAENIQGAEFVVRSSAVPDENPEVQAALAHGIPVLKRSDFLGSLLKEDYLIAVAGSHGKTTTSAMLAWTLTSLGKDPGYILGGISRNLSSNAHSGTGKTFIIEADEYDNMFLGLNPSMILLTNVEYDHPDCFPDQESYLAAFESFIRRLQEGGSLVACADHPVTKRLLASLPARTSHLTYGLQETAAIRAVGLKPNENGGLSFEVITAETAPFTVALQVPGEHNVLNALGVLAVHSLLENPLAEVASALSQFKGTGRRFEVVGETHGITVIDDYAHHPTKIRATLSAARLRYPGRRLIAVWQPHTFSRTKALRREFADALRLADEVIVTDIYPSREKVEPFDYPSLVTEIGLGFSRHIAAIPACSRWLLDHLLPGDVLLVLSAGDANQICTTVLQGLNERKE